MTNDLLIGRRSVELLGNITPDTGHEVGLLDGTPHDPRLSGQGLGWGPRWSHT